MARCYKADYCLDKYFPVLDNGYVGLIDYMGDDNAIVQAARVSYGEGTKTVSDDRALIRYLIRNKHTTPVEMVQFKFHISMPIHMHRQFIRHRMSTTNEYSARYSIVPEVTYDLYNLNLQSSSNKQGRSTSEEVSGIHSESLCKKRDDIHVKSFELYNEMVQAGVAREIARMHLPLNTYTYFYWKIDLHNLFHFLRLRCDSHAQEEIRRYADVLAGFVKEVCPNAFEAWVDYVYGSVTLSLMERKFLFWVAEKGLVPRDILLPENSTHRSCIEAKKYAEALGMSSRELDELKNKVNLPEVKDFTLDFSKTIKPNKG